MHVKILSIALAVALFVAGFLATELRSSDADAQGTWQVEYFRSEPIQYEATLQQAVAFAETLSTECDVDFEAAGNLHFIVAYRCP